MSAGNTVIIEELGGQKRRLELRGPGLPHKGASWKTEMRMSTEWYPGNPQEATQQVLGPAEMPSSWEGFWRLTMLNRYPCKYSEDGGTPTDIIQPTTLRDICDSMFYMGQRLRVTWIATAIYKQPDGSMTSTGHNIVREGRCKSWDFPHDSVEDIGWNFEFEWVSRGATVQHVTSTRDEDAETALAKFSAASENALNSIANAKIKTAKQGIKNSTSSLTLGQLESLAGAPQAILDSFGRTIQTQISSLEKLAAIANKVRSMPYALANSVVGIARNITTFCNQTTDTFTRMPPESYTLTNNVSDLTRNASYVGKSVETQMDLARQAQALEVSQQQIINSRDARGARMQPRSSVNSTSMTTLGVHVVHEGDTPHSISMKWYSSPDHALDILRANKMPIMTVQLVRGKSLVIPALTNTGM